MAAVYQQAGKWILDVSLYGKRIRKTLNARTEEEARVEGDDLLSGNIEGLHKRHRHQLYRRPDIQTLHWKTKTHAIQRGLKWNISLDELIQMFDDCGQRCEISGIPFDLKYKPDGATKRPFCASLDRINNSLGYTRENCRLVCSIVNVAMGEWGIDALQTMCNAMTLHRRPKKVSH
jgi:hypothetical protein